MCIADRTRMIGIVNGYLFSRVNSDLSRCAKSEFAYNRTITVNAERQEEKKIVSMMGVLVFMLSAVTALAAHPERDWTRCMD